MEAFRYKVRLSRRRTMSLNIERDGSVLVRAPLGTPERTVEDFVARHRTWVVRKLQEYRPVFLDLSDGAEIVLFGARYRIAAGKPDIAAGTVFLPEERREEALAKLLRTFTREVMEIFTFRLARAYGFSCAGVSVGSARGRWGSCSREGTIHYTFRLAFLPTAIVEYVAVHELCHTVHFDHSPAFRQEVENCLPDWKERRRALREMGGVMDLL